jgi:hypothetical protein
MPLNMPIRSLFVRATSFKFNGPTPNLWNGCRGPDGKEGWVHRSFLSESSGHATAVSDYSAKELTASEGERGQLLQVLDGWALVELEGSRVGWIPEGALHTSNI